MTPEIRHWEKMRDNLVRAISGLMVLEPPMVMVVTEGAMDRKLGLYEPATVEFQAPPKSPRMVRALETLAELNRRIEQEWDSYLEREIAAAMTPLQTEVTDRDIQVTARYR